MDSIPVPYERPPPPYEAEVGRPPIAVNRNAAPDTAPLLGQQQPPIQREQASFSIKAFLLHWACIGENGETNVVAGRLCAAVFFTLAVLGVIMVGISVAVAVEVKQCTGLTLELQIFSMLAQSVGPILLVLWICVACSRRRKMTCVACFAWLVSLYFVAVMSGLGTTLVQERLYLYGSEYNLGQVNQELCNIVRYIPLGTLCALGGMALFFCVVSCVACCCCRVAGAF
ncbi:hypothetical protein EMCRGX_G033964 [Ephydatia muelleri]